MNPREKAPSIAESLRGWLSPDGKWLPVTGPGGTHEMTARSHLGIQSPLKSENGDPRPGNAALWDAGWRRVVTAGDALVAHGPRPLTPTQLRFLRDRAIEDQYSMVYDESPKTGVVVVWTRQDDSAPAVVESLIAYHGGPPINPPFRVPAFFTTSADGAEWYASEKGGPSGDVGRYQLDLSKTFNATTKEGCFALIDVARQAGVEIQLDDRPRGWSFYCPEVAKHSPYDGENVLDLLYIPKVRQALLNQGYDSVHAWDQLERDEIDTYVVLDPSKIHSDQPARIREEGCVSAREIIEAAAGTNPFPESKVQQLVYHGTGAKFSRFRNGTQGIIWFTSDKEKILRREAGASGHGYLVSLYVDLRNPAGWEQYERLLLAQFRGDGLDGAILPDGNQFDGFVFSPAQTKVVSVEPV